jgi:hypothetical protein
VLFAAYRVGKNRVDLPLGCVGWSSAASCAKCACRSASGGSTPSARPAGEFDFEGRAVKPAVLTLPTGNEKRLPAAEATFHNWSGLAMALRGQQISDFPLCNKSFDLSYCGFDL